MVKKPVPRAAGVKIAPNAPRSARAATSNLERCGAAPPNAEAPGEAEQADDEDPLAAEQVTDTSAKQEQPAESQGVGGYHPLPVGSWRSRGHVARRVGQC